jgi:hypothetical protein
MSESQDKKPTEVLRTRRLEIVDDEGKVRALLGTNEEGVTSLSVFDQSKRLRISLDASENPEQLNGLGVFDTYGKRQISMGAHAISEKGGGFHYNGPNGETHVGTGADEEGGELFFKGANGEPRAGLNVRAKSSSLYWCDVNGERRGGLGTYEDGQSSLRASADRERWRP